MRLPNGYGNISKLSGRRRKPWRVRKTDGWQVDELTGRTRQAYTTVGYYATRSEAMKALASFNADPVKAQGDKTFADVYSEWSAQKFNDISQPAIRAYKASYNICAPLHAIPMCDIKLATMQAVIDTSQKGASILSKVKVLLSQLFDYAIIHEIINKSMVEYLKIPEIEKSNIHYRFTQKEIDVLWSNVDSEAATSILILIYTGVRPGELIGLHKDYIDLEQKIISIPKGKTKNAIRKIPIHEKIYPFFSDWMKKEGDYFMSLKNESRTNLAQYDYNIWKPTLLKLGIFDYIGEDGKKHTHKPDDTRHTFTTMWIEKKLSEPIRRKIQGHSGKGIGEEVYTHLSIDEMSKELNKL